jgi:hypothetical protein
MDADVRAADVVLNKVQRDVEARLPRTRRFDPRTRMLLEGSAVTYVFASLSAALVAFGLMNAGAVAGGAWFGPIACRGSTALGLGASFGNIGVYASGDGTPSPLPGPRLAALIPDRVRGWGSSVPQFEQESTGTVR